MKRRQHIRAIWIFLVLMATVLGLCGFGFVLGVMYASWTL